MMKKSLIFLMITAFLLSGCGTQMPEMTEQESELVAEYAVGLLMKYNVRHQSRLLNDAQLARELERLENLAAQKKAAQTEKERPKEESSQEDVQSDVITKPAVSGKYIEEFYGIEGISVRYQGYEVADSYPNSGEELYFMMQANSGKKLLVLKFRAQNLTQEDKTMDMISIMPRFKVSVNGERAQYALSTLLSDDLANYKGTIAAGGTKELVLMAEIPEEMADNITSVSVSMQNESGSETILLD